MKVIFRHTAIRCFGTEWVRYAVVDGRGVIYLVAEGGWAQQSVRSPTGRPSWRQLTRAKGQRLFGDLDPRALASATPLHYARDYHAWRDAPTTKLELVEA